MTYQNSLTQNALVAGTRVKPGNTNFNKDAVKSITVEDTLAVTTIEQSYTCSNTPDDSNLNDVFHMTETLSDGVPVWQGDTYGYYMYRVNNGERRWFISDDYNTLTGEDIVAISEATTGMPPSDSWDTNPTGGTAPVYTYDAGSNVLGISDGSLTAVKFNDSVAGTGLQLVTVAAESYVYRSGYAPTTALHDTFEKTELQSDGVYVWKAATTTTYMYRWDLSGTKYWMIGPDYSSVATFYTYAQDDGDTPPESGYTGQSQSPVYEYIATAQSELQVTGESATAAAMTSRRVWMG